MSEPAPSALTPDTAAEPGATADLAPADADTPRSSAPAAENSEGASTGAATAVLVPDATGITALTLRRIRTLSLDWAAVLAAAALAVAVGLGWKVTW